MYASKKLPMTLLPKVPGLKLENLLIDTDVVLLSVASTRPSASCPICRQESARLHSHYLRTRSTSSIRTGLSVGGSGCQVRAFAKFAPTPREGRAMRTRSDHAVGPYRFVSSAACLDPMFDLR